MITVAKFLVLALAGLVGVEPGLAQTIYVDQTTGSDSDDGLTPEDAVETVTHGFSLLSSGGTLIVGPGVYAESSGEVFPTGISGDVLVIGAGPSSTILDGEDGTQVLSLGGLSSTVTLRDLAVVDGDSPIGGGIFVSEPGLLTIDGCRIEGNSASIGGGLHVQVNTNTTVQLSIVDSEFIGNTASITGGVQLQQNADGAYTLVVDRSTFRGNGSNGLGLGANAGTLTGTVTNSVFAGHPNVAVNGGVGAIDFVNTSFDSNFVALSTNGPVEVANSIFWNNGTEISGSGGTVSFSIVEGLEIGGHTDGGNNSSVDPLWTANQRLLAGSPAIDQGSDLAAAAFDPNHDIDRNQRPFDVQAVVNGSSGFIDLGAHEFGSTLGIGEIFSDGFESGTVSAWSFSAP